MKSITEKADENRALLNERDRLEDSFMDGKLSNDELTRLKSIIGDEQFFRLEGAKAAFESYMASRKSEELRRVLLEAARAGQSEDEEAAKAQDSIASWTDSLSGRARDALERLRALLPPSNQPILRFPLVVGAACDSVVETDPKLAWSRYLNSEVKRDGDFFVVRAWVKDEGAEMLRQAEGAKGVLVGREVLDGEVIVEPFVLADFDDRGRGGFMAYAKVPARSGNDQAILEVFADQIQAD